MEVPTRLDKDKLKDYAQLDARYEVWKAWSVVQWAMDLHECQPQHIALMVWPLVGRGRVVETRESRAVKKRVENIGKNPALL